VNPRDAQDIIRMIESNWHFDLGPARSMWLSEIMMWDVEMVIKALAHLSRRQSFKIVLADIVQVLEMYERNAKDDERRAREAKALSEGRRGYAPPEWVLVWSWARAKAQEAWEKGRVKHEDRKLRGFPQQGDWSDPRTTMTTAEYDDLREQWVAAGSPRAVSQLVGDLS
jgi:hypothetical protein